MSTEELREQVAAIKPGDIVNARFSGDPYEYVVAGVARTDGVGHLCLGLNVLRFPSGKVADAVLAIESHEPAKPPVPPEPTGDVVVRERGLKVRDRWWAPRPGACGDQWWKCLSDDRLPLHEWNELRDALVYRPEAES